MTKGAAKITPQKIAAAKSRSDKNKKLAWDALKTRDSRDYRFTPVPERLSRNGEKRLLQDKRNLRAGFGT